MSDRESPADGRVDDARLTTGDVRSKAAAGALMLTARGIVIRSLGFLGSLVLARLLAPEDFGVVALGMTLVGLGSFLADAGLGMGLVGRKESPALREIKALVGFQLAVTSALAAAAAAIGVLAGGAGLLVAVMMIALPLQAPRSSAVLLLQRRLDFRATVYVELSETLVYLTWAISGAALGFGAWALGTAMIGRALVGTIVAVRLAPIGLVRPTLDLDALRSLMGFGVRFTATGALNIARDAGLNAGVAAIAGLGVLGLWSFALRLLGLPQLALEALWGVAFPALARLIAQGEDVRPLLERSASTVTLLTGLTLAPFVAASPALIPALFGEVWSDTSVILAGGALALTGAAATSVCGMGYLYAVGDASTPLRNTVVASTARLAATFALLPLIGLWAISIGWVTAVVAGNPIVLRAIRERCGARLGLRAFVPSIAVSLAAAAGWTLCETMNRSLLGALAAFTITPFMALLLAALFDRTGLREALRTARNGLRLARSGLRRLAPAAV